MLHQKPSGIWARLKYLLILPVCAGLLCISTLCFSKTYGSVDLMPRKYLPLSKSVKPGFAATKTNTGITEKISFHKKYIDSNDHVTAKGYHYTETSFINRDGKLDLSVIIFTNEKNRDNLKVMKSRATSAIRKMLEEKFGYTFPTKIPPPPPAPPKTPHGPNAPIGNRFPPPAVVPVRIPAPAVPGKPPVPAGAQTLEPPMAPHEPLSGPFTSLGKYLARHTHYPATEFKNHIMGSVIMQFDLTADHKIANVTMIKGFATACDNEALSVLKSYNEMIDKTPGTYKVAVTFYLDHLKAPEPASSTLYKDPAFIGEQVIEMYPD